MPNILHRVGIASQSKDVYEALATREGLARWWTADTTGGFDVGGVIRFRFGPRGGFDMKVVELDPARRVRWQVVEGPAEWIGTKVSFELAPGEGGTFVLFEHQGWKAPSAFMHHCSTKWALFLMSLKSLVETGKGAPYPDDVHITHDTD